MAAVEEVNGGSHDMARDASADAGPSKPAPSRPSVEEVRESLDVPSEASPRSSLDADARINQLEQDLQQARQEKDVLSTQYRSLLGKLTAMRTSLGEKLQEDAEELDRRETAINNLTTENTTLQAELANANEEAANAQSQLAKLRSQSDSSSSDVLSLTREMRELRGVMEGLRIEREEWEGEAGREREKRENMEDEVRQMERREREMRIEFERGRDELEGERERAQNLQDVLGEFQAAKESELRQATSDLESQLRLAATALSEYKLRTANAETRLGELERTVGRSVSLEKEIKEKNQMIGKLRHDAVVNNEHLTEALRRLRNSTSDTNVDRRLVTNFLLAFLATSRSDTKRFEMLSLLATVLQWDDTEREKAGLQRIGGVKGEKSKVRKKSKVQDERSAEEQAAMNESFSNLFVEFLLKEASQGQPSRPHMSHSSSMASSSSPSQTPSVAYSPSHSGASTPTRSRAMSTSSFNSSMRSPPDRPIGLPVVGRQNSLNLQQALDRRDGT